MKIVLPWSRQIYILSLGRIAKDFLRPDLFSNIEKIVNECNLELDLDNIILPHFERENKEDSFEYLEKIVWDNYEKEYSNKNPIAKKRLTYELEVIKKTGFADYFLIIHDLIQFTKEQGILTNTRGSAAGSFVAYILEHYFC